MYGNYIFIDWPISRTETWCSIFIISASKIRWLSLSTFLSQCIIFSLKRKSLYVLPSCITTEYFFEWSRLFSTLHKLLAWFHLRLLDKGSNPNLHFENIIISLFCTLLRSFNLWESRYENSKHKELGHQMHFIPVYLMTCTCTRTIIMTDCDC